MSLLLLFRSQYISKEPLLVDYRTITNISMTSEKNMSIPSREDLYQTSSDNLISSPFFQKLWGLDLWKHLIDFCDHHDVPKPFIVSASMSLFSKTNEPIHLFYGVRFECKSCNTHGLRSYNESHFPHYTRLARWWNAAYIAKQKLIRWLASNQNIVMHPIAQVDVAAAFSCESDSDNELQFLCPDHEDWWACDYNTLWPAFPEALLHQQKIVQKQKQLLQDSWFRGFLMGIKSTNCVLHELPGQEDILGTILKHLLLVDHHQF